MGTDRILGTRLGTRKNNLYLIIKVYGDISRSFDSPHLHHIPKTLTLTYKSIGYRRGFFCFVALIRSITPFHLLSYLCKRIS